jgi:hypothetical protein
MMEKSGSVSSPQFLTSLFKVLLIIILAHGMLEDADDTAKNVLLLNLLGRPTSPQPFISHFISSKGHIMTYLHERNPSPSANCNALLCLLSVQENTCLLPAVESIINALCNCWCENQMVDKWVIYHINLPQKFSLI